MLRSTTVRCVEKSTRILHENKTSQKIKYACDNEKVHWNNVPVILAL